MAPKVDRSRSPAAAAARAESSSTATHGTVERLLGALGRTREGGRASEADQVVTDAFVGQPTDPPSQLLGVVALTAAGDGINYHDGSRTLQGSTVVRGGDVHWRFSDLVLRWQACSVRASQVAP